MVSWAVYLVCQLVTLCHFICRRLYHRSIMSRLLLGDSNIVKYLPVLKEKMSDPAIKSVVVTRTTNAISLEDAVCHPKSAHTTVIVSALTNLLTAKFFDDFDERTAHCKTVFNDLLL